SLTEAAWTAVARTTRTAYDVAGNVVEVTDPLGRRTLRDHDELGRLSTLTEAADTDVERRTTYAYDEADRVTSVTAGLSDDPGYAPPSTTHFDYDALGRRTVATEAVGTDAERATETAYDAADNPVRTTDPRGYPTVAVFDELNQRRQLTEAVGTPAERTATFAYDAVGNLVGTTTGLAPVNPHRQVTR